jgi:hypothetical protein
MALDPQKIEQHRKLSREKSEVASEIRRIKGFFGRSVDNKDTRDAMVDTHIRVKVAGTSMMLPYALFEKELKKREKELETRLPAIDTELDEL